MGFDCVGKYIEGYSHTQDSLQFAYLLDKFVMLFLVLSIRALLN